MIDTKFTPGPWFIVEPNGAGNGFRIEASGPTPGLPGAWIGVDLHSPEQRANVNVMRAAPRMYKALEEIVKWVDLPHSDGWDTPRGLAIKEAEMALRQARGEDA